MLGLRGSVGFEVMPLVNVTLGLFGDARWQSGMPHVEFPQEIVASDGSLTFTSTGPAHIGYDNRAFWGFHGAVRVHW